MAYRVTCGGDQPPRITRANKPGRNRENQSGRAHNRTVTTVISPSEAIQLNSLIITEKTNMSSLWPHFNAGLTSGDYIRLLQRLSNSSEIEYDRIQYLLNEMRHDDLLASVYINALQQTISGTGHKDIITALKRTAPGLFPQVNVPEASVTPPVPARPPEGWSKRTTRSLEVQMQHLALEQQGVQQSEEPSATFEELQDEGVWLRRSSSAVTDSLGGNPHYLLKTVAALDDQGLLIRRDNEYLTNSYHTADERAQELLCILPRKESGWSGRFLSALVKVVREWTSSSQADHELKKKYLTLVKQLFLSARGDILQSISGQDLSYLENLK